jgi:hypothetical protein
MHSVWAANVEDIWGTLVRHGDVCLPPRNRSVQGSRLCDLRQSWRQSCVALDNLHAIAVLRSEAQPESRAVTNDLAVMKKKKTSDARFGDSPANLGHRNAWTLTAYRSPSETVPPAGGVWG